MLIKYKQRYVSSTGSTYYYKNNGKRKYDKKIYNANFESDIVNFPITSAITVVFVIVSIVICICKLA